MPACPRSEYAGGQVCIPAVGCPWMSALWGFRRFGDVPYLAASLYAVFLREQVFAVFADFHINRR